MTSPGKSLLAGRLSALRRPMPEALYARLTRIAMVLLGLIVVSGAAVRLTGSGLGCPTWPQCGDGSFVARSQYSLHGLVEFGNRVVSTGVGIFIAVLVVGALRLQQRRRELVLLADLLALAAAAVLILGTVVTGAGPHSGDTGHVRRFDINIRSAAQLHADSAMLLTGLIIAMAFAVRLTSGPGVSRRLANALTLTVIGQATIGFVQYFLEIPVGLVAIHVAGATLLWILALYLRLSLTGRVPVSDQLVDGQGEEEQRQIGDREVEQPHRPRVAAGGGTS
jgi:heme A synthase